jgi:hypothetical protein
MTHRAPARAAARSLAVPATGTPAVLRVAPSGRLVAAVALVALIGTGCSNTPAGTGSGGGEKSAPAGGSSTGTGDDQSAAAGATPSPAELEERRKSAKCMRENGVEDFPDPDANGHILYYGDDPDMESASEKCDELQPGDRVREPGSGG